MSAVLTYMARSPRRSSYTSYLHRAIPTPSSSVAATSTAWAGSFELQHNTSSRKYGHTPAAVIKHEKNHRDGAVEITRFFHPGYLVSTLASAFESVMISMPLNSDLVANDAILPSPRYRQAGQGPAARRDKQDKAK